MIIAMDGVAGAGKTTIAKQISQQTKFIYFSSGRLYRAIALKCIQCGMDKVSHKNLAKILGHTSLSIEFVGKEQRTILDGKDVTSSLYIPAVSSMSSEIAKYKIVREFATNIQRKVARGTDAIVEGRDIGTVVFPDAEIKIYLTASPETRAKRRLSDLRAIGNTEISFDEVFKAMKARDEQDMGRKNSPLKMTNDFICIDTTNLTIDEVIKKILNEVEKKKQCFIG